jgi:hypothetical protein
MNQATASRFVNGLNVDAHTSSPLQLIRLARLSAPAGLAPKSCPSETQVF